MTRMQAAVWYTLMTLTLIVISAGRAGAHNGEDHSGQTHSSSLVESPWLGIVAVVVLLAIVYGIAQRHEPEQTTDPPDEIKE